MAQITKGIEFLHSIGLVHRDLKPPNILILIDSNSWTAKVADYGRTTRSTDAATLPVGTRGYMAPEVESKKAFTEQSDIYSLSIIFMQIWKWNTSYFDFQQPHFPSDLCEIICKCRHTNYGTRPTIEELLSTLNNLKTSIPNSV